MANTSFKGPVRSQNGFQEWNGTAWVPVAGGGGGGTTRVEITAENRYSTNYFVTPPSPGITVQIPNIGVGETFTIMPPFDGPGLSTWRLELAQAPDADITSYYGAMTVTNSYSSEYEPILYRTFLGSAGPTDAFYLYGQLFTPLQFIRAPNLIVPGFGTVALYVQVGTCAMYVAPWPSAAIYPYTDLLP